MSQSNIYEDGDDSPFGTWLRAEREKKHWTQRELADAAGLSAQQISNIETSLTRNPQPRTRDKLSTALGVMAPADIIEAEEAEATVVGLGPLVGFEPHDEDALPDFKGVYVLYDRTKRPVYVGRATKRSIRIRVLEHTEKFWFKAPLVQSAAYLAIADENLCKQTEQILIKFMRTHLLLNKQGVEAESDEDETL